jgi:hypothetical protein
MLRSITSPGFVNAAVVGKGREVNIEFLIAPSAKKQIECLVDELKRRKGKADVIPAVMWIDAQMNCEVSGPAIGFYDNRDEIVDDISVVEASNLFSQFRLDMSLSLIERCCTTLTILSS